jgi:pyruvoyl-dependent arginine decarboxylase (PvlArgDC)
MSNSSEVIRLIWSTAADIVSDQRSPGSFANYRQKILAKQDEVEALVAKATAALSVSKRVEEVLKTKHVDAELTNEELQELLAVLNFLIIGKGRVKK